jgi:hypothetical protein
MLSNWNGKEESAVDMMTFSRRSCFERSVKAERVANVLIGSSRKLIEREEVSKINK